MLSEVATGRPWTGEVECNRRDRTRVPIFLTLSAVYDDDRAVLGFVAEARDLSDLSGREPIERRRAPCPRAADAHGRARVRHDGGRQVQVRRHVGLLARILVLRPDRHLRVRSRARRRRRGVRDAYAEVAADASAHPVIVYRARAKRGTWRWREVRLSNRLDDPILAGIVCNVTDITEQQELLAELRAADARQRAIVARSRDATLFFDTDGTIRWASPISYELIGIAPEALLGQNGLDFIHPDDQERVFAEFITIAGLGDHVRTEFRVNHPRGGVRWVEEDATNLVDDPDVGYIVANIRDITDRKHAQEQLERLALHDPLTGLPNRSLLVNRLEQLLARGSAAAVLYIDIDNFGDVNDSLGHAAGDELLQLIGARFAAAVLRSPPTLARVGGDEFVLLCDDVGDATTAFSYAERLREPCRCRSRSRVRK